MKKELKKLITITSSILTLCNIVSAHDMPSPVVGEKIADAVYSDLAVYINHYPIPSYNVNDYSVIIAEDLVNYCCDVAWNEESRTLNITKSSDKNEFTPPAVYKPSVPTGTFFRDVLFTDITTFVNGKEVTSFNINGQTMIVIDEFGECMDGYTWAPGVHSAKAWLENKHMKDFNYLEYRTKEILNMAEYCAINTSVFSDYDDLNLDGTDEFFEIICDGDNHLITVKFNNIIRTIETENSPNTMQAYVCDVDTNDGVKDLAFTISEIDAGDSLYILKCDNNLTPYRFEEKNPDGSSSYIDHCDLGYIGFYSKFNFNDDGTFSVKSQTNSYGMWSIIKNYSLANGFFTENISDYYEVIPEHYSTYGLKSKEKEMSEIGYIKAHSDFHSNNITINKNEYFTVVFDDCKDNLYITKENGESGWICIKDRIHDLMELNEDYFYIAG